LPNNSQSLEHRQATLLAAILYVEEQNQHLSRDTAAFLSWAKDELLFVETLLRQQRLRDQFLAFGHAPRRMLAAA
jgi:hypothetical protein